MIITTQHQPGDVDYVLGCSNNIPVIQQITIAQTVIVIDKNGPQESEVDTQGNSWAAPALFDTPQLLAADLLNKFYAANPNDPTNPNPPATNADGISITVHTP